MFHKPRSTHTQVSKFFSRETLQLTIIRITVILKLHLMKTTSCSTYQNFGLFFYVSFLYNDFLLENQFLEQSK